MKLFLLLSFFLSFHPVHVTLMSAEYAENLNVFNVFLKVYSDDFLLDYKALTGDTSRIDLSDTRENTKKILGRYLGDKVEIFADGKKLNCKILNYESSDGELKMNLEYDNVKNSKRYLVRNKILTDIYKDQSNLLIFRMGNYEEGVKLTADIIEQEFNIK
jgi:hypothetical protein